MLKVIAVGKSDLAPLVLPDRFRTEVVYFMTPADAAGLPTLGPSEYWIKLDEARQWLDDCCISIMSPLSAESQTEMELTDYQEQWLEWLVANQVQHIRLEAA